MIDIAIFFKNSNYFEIAHYFYLSPSEVICPTTPHMYTIYKVSRSISDRMVITIEKITKMAAI